MNLDVGSYHPIMNVLHMILGEKCVEPSSEVYCEIRPSAQGVA